MFLSFSWLIVLRSNEFLNWVLNWSFPITPTVLSQWPKWVISHFLFWSMHEVFILIWEEQRNSLELSQSSIYSCRLDFRRLCRFQSQHGQTMDDLYSIDWYLSWWEFEWARLFMFLRSILVRLSCICRCCPTIIYCLGSEISISLLHKGSPKLPT